MRVFFKNSVCMLLAFFQGVKLKDLLSVKGRIVVASGVDLVFKGKARIFELEVVGIGRLIIEDDVEIRGLYVHLGAGAEVHICKNVFIGKDVKIIAHEKVFIGARSLIAPNVVFVDNDHVIGEGPIKHSGLVCGPIFIGEDCWVGATSVVVKGSVLGDGSVLGAMSMLNSSASDNSVYIGVPARKVRGIA